MQKTCVTATQHLVLVFFQELVGGPDAVLVFITQRVVVLVGVLLLRMFFALFCTIWRVRLK